MMGIMILKTRKSTICNRHLKYDGEIIGESYVDYYNAKTDTKIGSPIKE